ncbi:MAG: hypothetical protein DMG80_14355 [Acidobacteria bacterium]|nr:MAG: hypothetical protein DMG80_14355 [Acidobacteriota bacterium]
MHFVRVFRSAGSVAPLPALHILMIASHSRVTMFAKTGDYNSWTALSNTFAQEFFFFNSGSRFRACEAAVFFRSVESIAEKFSQFRKSAKL